MLQRSTIQLLRFPFSFFLMPIYWFGLSQVPVIDMGRALLVFIILHLLVYPASNGYNSYMDRDESPIGGLEKPMPPTRQLFYISLLMDLCAFGLGFFISPYFSFALGCYILASRAYSYRGIRLKKYPVAGYLTVVVFQGAVSFWMVYHGASAGRSLAAPWPLLCSASLLIGGFYPLTQIYQHADDQKDGVTTLSYRLGRKGTFVFTALLYAAAFAFIAYWFLKTGQQISLLILQALFIPVIIYFFRWARKTWKDEREASFQNTMRMNLLASACCNFSFIIILILHHIE